MRIKSRSDAISQMSFSDAEYVGKRNRTRRKLSLAEMDHVVPWHALLALIEPGYPKAGKNNNWDTHEQQLGHPRSSGGGNNNWDTHDRPEVTSKRIRHGKRIQAGVTLYRRTPSRGNRAPNRLGGVDASGKVSGKQHCPRCNRRKSPRIGPESAGLLPQPLRGSEPFQPTLTHRLCLLDQHIRAADGAEVSAFDAEHLVVPLALGQTECGEDRRCKNGVRTGSGSLTGSLTRACGS